MEDSAGKKDPPLGEFATHRSTGTTPSERSLVQLVEGTFLSAWSYPNIWRDQRAQTKKNCSDGKEVCDVLVVCGDHVIIFSDKDIAYPNHPNEDVRWNRWYKSAVERGAAQVFGAERWIRQFPKRLFLDKQCTKPFPIALPRADQIVIHRIAVARGASAACRTYFGSGTGSLMIAPDLIGGAHYLPRPDPPLAGRPFAIGYVDTECRYVHVLDDVTLLILMQTLDTVRDFVDYLSAKERFISSGRRIFAAGEEELLAHYLKHTNSSGDHDFVVPADTGGIVFGEGGWAAFQAHPQRLAQIEANRTSYLWDELIERFSFHALNDSQYYSTGRGVAEAEISMRFLARECRTRRRLLAEAVLGLVERARRRDTRPFEVRIVAPSRQGDPYYVLLAARDLNTESYNEYRERRRAVLESYVTVVKVKYPSAVDIIGIAFDAKQDSSEDLIYLDCRDWTSEQQLDAEQLQQNTGFLNSVKPFKGRFDEYPNDDEHRRASQLTAKGRDRNRPCPCGSGLKWKRCHGP